MQTEPTRRIRRADSFQPAHRFRINFVLLDRVAAGHEQRIDLSAHFAKSPICGDAQTAVGNQRAAGRNGHDFDRINWRRSGILPVCISDARAKT